MLKISNMMRAAGAKKVHVRIAAPPTIRPCHYGIDMPTRSELIASNKTVDEVRAAIGADSLGYLSLDGLRGLGKKLEHGHCDACFSEEYPVPISGPDAVPQLMLFRTVEAEADEVAADEDE
jgi:amidophosphoribosyltransferase